MFEIINAFKEGYSVWKGVWLRQIIVPMVLGFVFSLIIIPFGFLIAIFGTDLRDSGGVGNNSAGISGLFQQIIDYPLFWLSILATAFIGMIISQIKRLSNAIAAPGVIIGIIPATSLYV